MKDFHAPTLNSPLSEPFGTFSFDLPTGHEIIEMICALSQPDHGLFLFSDPTNDDHLEPFRFWQVPFRGAKIIIMKGIYSGRWDLDFIGYNKPEAPVFTKYLTDHLSTAAGLPSQDVMKSLWHCDSNGCPLGRVNYN